MESKSANPFLFMEEDYVSPSSSSNNSNPFLMGGDSDYSNDFTGSDNPFLSQTAVTAATTAVTATNPFAFDPMDYAPVEAPTAEVANFQDNSQNMFNDTGPVTNTTNDFFNSVSDIIPNEIPLGQTMAPMKPTGLDLKHTNTVSHSENVIVYSSDEELSKANMPKRPPLPPGRPPIPPSKETQDLIMTVTGAMDATSSHLLDRIPPTRTPSPVSIRDLHSPSPTPEPTFADLLDVSDNRPPPAQMDFLQDSNDNEQQQQPIINNVNLMQQQQQPPQDNQADLLMGLNEEMPTCDINQNPPPSRPVIPPVRPAAPPRPTPPKPPPPSFANHVPDEEQHHVITQPPTVETTINQSIINQEPVAAEQNDGFMDMFGTESVPTHKPIASTADIMSLYSAPTVTKPQTATDLMFDSVDNPDTVTPLSVDNYISPEPTSQADLQMDTSDSQSKGSVSSVTFNPFGGVEEAPSVPMAVPSPMKTPVDMIPQPEMVQEMDTASEPIDVAMPMYEPPPPEVEPTPVVALHHEPPPVPVVHPHVPPPVPAVHSHVPPAVPPHHVPPAVPPHHVSPSVPPHHIPPAVPPHHVPPAVPPHHVHAAPPPAVSPIRPAPPPVPPHHVHHVQHESLFASSTAPAPSDSFDAFAAKFDSVAKDENKGAFDPFSGVGGGDGGGDAWGSNGNDAGGFGDSSAAFGDSSAAFGDSSAGFGDSSAGFGAEEPFDAFLSMQAPPATAPFGKGESQDSDEDKDFAVFIRPKASNEMNSTDVAMPILAPPPAVSQSAFTDTSPRFNPFDQSELANAAISQDAALPLDGAQMERTDSQETPPTPLFDEDVSQPLEAYPRIDWAEDGWEMQLRQPNKKKITGQRFWKKIFVRLVTQMDVVLLQLFNTPTDKDAFQELPLQPCYSVSEIGAQQYDQYGKIFTLKLQYVFYKERPGVRPGQVTKAERITNKLSQFAAYAIQGDYQGVKEFGSDLKKLGLPVEHAPQVSQLLKLGSLSFEDMKQFSVSIEEALFKLQAHRDRALHYKMEEVQVTAVDELYVEQDADGHIEKQIARVRLFFLGFLTGMPDIELGLNDLRRQGKEVVGRHDIIPVITEEWIRIEVPEFHSCVQNGEYDNSHVIKFKPPDACYIELMRFRIRPPKNRELPLQLKATMCVTGNKVELRADVLVPGFASRKLGQVPCEDVMIRFPIPECWIYLFRVEKHFRYGSVKSAHRRTGKIKGIERFLGAVDTLQESLIEVTSGQAKYEHQHRAIVWRCPRLPKEGQGAYTTHNLVCRLALTSYDQVPEQLAEYAYVEFTMPATQASHTTVRSVSLQNSDSDEPPEKYVRYLARHEYRVGIEHTEGEGPAAYAAATMVSRTPAPVPEEPAPPPAAEAESSSDSD